MLKNNYNSSKDIKDNLRLGGGEERGGLERGWDGGGVGAKSYRTNALHS